MTLTITAAPQYEALPVVRLTVTSANISPHAPDDIRPNSLITVTRIHEDGGRHVVLTDQGPRLAGGGWAWLDIHCPFNGPVVYEVKATDPANGTAVALSTAVWLISSKAYLVHSSVADLAVEIDAVVKIGDRQVGTRSSTFTPVGGREIYLTDGARGGVSGTVEFRCAVEAPYRDLFADDSVILLNTPATAGWDLGWLWIQPGDITYSNPGEINAYRYRRVQMPYKETSDPFADLQPAWTSADALAYWTTTLGQTSAGIVANYATSLDFLTNTGI